MKKKITAIVTLKNGDVLRLTNVHPHANMSGVLTIYDGVDTDQPRMIFAPGEWTAVKTEIAP